MSLVIKAGRSTYGLWGEDGGSVRGEQISGRSTCGSSGEGEEDSK